MARTFGKDTYVWLQDDEEVYIPARVKATFAAGEKGTVLNLFSDNSYTLSAADSKACLPMDPQSLKPIEDMVMLKQLDEPSLLHNLRLRYEQDEIYTAIGTILVSVNPFKKLNIYTPEIVDNYIAKGGKDLPPHIFGTADNAYQSLVIDKKSQSCIVSGESGAGKTEATKLFLQYLAEKSSAGDDEAKSGAGKLHQKILEANPLMEAFGNAKTLRNNNSSRFGKLIQVDFNNKSGKIVGGNITSYLLEKSRIVNQAEGERNYHIFYQLCTYASTDPEYNKDLQLMDAGQYYYSNPNDAEDDIVVDGINDTNEFELTLHAMDTLDFGKTERKGLMTSVAAILNLGNIDFTESEDHAVIKESTLPVLERTAEMFGVDAGALADALLKTQVMETFRQHTVDDAIAARDAFAKSTYSYMFNWLIEKINKSLKKGGKSKGKKDVCSISVLDIFGFESFEINSFEQLCINYCNEKLQAHFNEHIFSIEQDLYAKEGVVLKRIDFTDNAPTLEKIEGAPNGVLSILDEVCRLPRGTDLVFRDKIHDMVDDHIIKKPGVKELRKEKNKLVFSVVHYAGEVAYTVTNFLEKNKDKLLEGLFQLGLSSGNKFIKDLYVQNSGSSNKKTLGTQFKGQLKELMDTLNATEPHYVRTIKPNDEKSANLYTAPMIMDQLRYAGLMEVCRIRKLGYPVRKDFKEFIQRYKPLALNMAAVKDNPKKLCDDLVEQGILNEGEFQIGKTKVFMRDNEFNNLERKRAGVLGKVAIIMQTAVRGYLARAHYKNYKKVLAEIKAASDSRDVKRIEAALVKTGQLPFLGKHLPIVKEAKKVMSQAKEEMKVLKLVDAAIESKDLNSLNSAISAAEKLNLANNPAVKKAAALRERVIKNRDCIASLKSAVDKNEIAALKTAITEAEALDLTKTTEFSDAVSALQYLQDVEETIAALDSAIAAKNAEEISAMLTKMAELGRTDHPSVKKGQEITNEIAKVSAETEKQKKLLTKNLQQAINMQDLAGLKKFRPKVLQFGIKGGIVDEASELIQKLEKKAEAFSELSAKKQALEIKYEGFDGVTQEDVDSFSELIAASRLLGLTDDDEELTAMTDFEVKMQDQIDAQKRLAQVLVKKDETELRKALAMIQDLGLKTGLAKEVQQEVQYLDAKILEKTAGDREKEKIELREKLQEGDEEARGDEKAAMLEARTEAHKALIAKAADTTKYDFTKYYKIREDGDYVNTLPEEAQEVFAEKKLQYQSKNIPKSLIDFPAEISKIAVQVFKGILQYCGDLANPYPNTMAKFMIVTCLENPIIVDEVYLQLMKHLTNNNKPVSEDRGWGLMCMMTSSVPPTDEFAPFLVNFLLQKKNVPGLIGNYARLCIVQLDGRISLGATTLIPDLEVVDTYSQRPPILAVIHRVDGSPSLEIPVTPDEDVDNLLGEIVFPQLNIDDDRQHLYGLFVIDGRPDTDLSLKKRLTRFYQRYNPAKLPHIEYFVNTWGENIEGLFHKLEKKYGPEPTEEEVAEAMRKKGKGSKLNILQYPISAAKQAAKRLGLTSGPSKPPPAPQTAWPVPWWVYLGDVYLRMVKQNRVPVFTFKRKLFVNGELMSKELIEQNRHDVVKGDLAVKERDDVVNLAAIHLTLRNGCQIPADKDLTTQEVANVIPVTWLADNQPKEFVPQIKEALQRLEGASEDVLNEKYMEICRNQPGYGMWFFYLAKPNSAEVTVAGVGTAGIHIMDQSRTTIRTTYGYRTIKEYGAGPSVFWMKVVKKDEKKKTVEKLINLNTIQAWDMYGLVYDYTFNADKLNLK